MNSLYGIVFPDVSTPLSICSILSSIPASRDRNNGVPLQLDMLPLNLFLVYMRLIAFLTLLLRYGGLSLPCITREIHACKLSSFTEQFKQETV